MLTPTNPKTPTQKHTKIKEILACVTILIANACIGIFIIYKNFQHTSPSTSNSRLKKEDVIFNSTLSKKNPIQSSTFQNTTVGSTTAPTSIHIPSPSTSLTRGTATPPNAVPTAPPTETPTLGPIIPPTAVPSSTQPDFYTCNLHPNETVTLPIFPKLIIAGAQKGGTSALYNILREIPSFRATERLEVHYFDTAGCGHGDRRVLKSKGGTFPCLDSPVSETDKCRVYHDYWRIAFSNKLPTSINEAALFSNRITFEKTPRYLSVRVVPSRIRHFLPVSPKILLSLRNPVDRAYSHFKMMWRQNKKKTKKNSFDAFVASSTKWLRKMHMINAPTYVAHPQDAPSNATFDDFDLYWGKKNFSLPSSGKINDFTHGFFLRGCYSEQLEFWMEEFHLHSEMKVIQYEHFEANKVDVLNEIVDFASNRQQINHTFKNTILEETYNVPSEFNATRYPPLSDNAKAYLKHFYKPCNNKLAAILGKDWKDVWE